MALRQVLHGVVVLSCLALGVWSVITDSQADIIRTAVRDAIDVNEDEGGTMVLRAGLVRLAFHDCVGDRCDGCINMALDDNAGLDTYINYTDHLYDDTDVDGYTMRELGFSRADFWALAAVEALDYSTEDAQSSGCRRTGCTYVYADITYQQGRVDCDTSPTTTEEADYPSGIGDTDHVVDFFADTFNFTEQETTAIMGAHALGAAHRDASGFVGPWTERQKQFSNQYYIDMFDGSLGWEMVQKGTRNNRVYQWTSANSTSSRMMLNADMALIFDIGDTTSEGEVVDCIYSTCPDATGDTEYWALIYANDNEYFLEHFGLAFTKMINHGYDSSSDVLSVSLR